MDKRRITKPDLLLLGVLLVIGIAGLAAVYLWTGKGGAAVRITVDGSLYGTYQLAQSQSIAIQSADGAVTNVLRIADGNAKMVQADCPDKRCMHQKAIARQGETIVCLPNKIVVEIEGKKTATFDSISQ